MPRTPPASLPLRPVELEILITLAQGERHGYAIIQETEARTAGRVRLGTGTLYRALRRLVDDQLVAPTAAPAGEATDDRRRTYRITARGRAVASAEASRLARLIDAARTAGLLPGRS